MTDPPRILEHATRVEESFNAQSATFEDPRLNFAFTESLDRLVDSCAPEVHHIVLDVAAGTGLVARRLAPHVAAVHAIDATQAMLPRGKAAADAEGLTNVIFQRGDATALPFVDESFSLVVSRFSLHHVEDPALLVGEMARVCRSGGRVVVFDLCAADDPDLALRQNHIEQLRDPSHVRTLTEPELAGLLTQADLRVLASSRRTVERSLRQWLMQGCTETTVADQIRQLLTSELTGGEATGMSPHGNGDTLDFTHTWATSTTSRPSPEQPDPRRTYERGTVKLTV